MLCVSIASGIGEYLCVNNVLKAHGKTYRLYRRKYFEKQKGKIGITLNGFFAYPLNYGTSTIELERAERSIQFMVRANDPSEHVQI